MDFEEFEKKFEEEEKYYSMGKEVGGLYYDLYDDDGLLIESSKEIWDENKQDFCDVGHKTIGKYDTLKEAYEVLKGICELNGVEME